MPPHCLFSHMAQQHLIKGESNLSSSTDRGAFCCTLRLISCACCDINRAISALTCKHCEQTGKYSAVWNALRWLSPLGKSYYSCQTLKSLCFFLNLYSTVLQNFTRKSRNTVLVREGQAVVLLCGPPPHYGGTVLCPNSSALSAVVSHSCLPQQSLLFPTLLLIISL